MSSAKTPSSRSRDPVTSRNVQIPSVHVALIGFPRGCTLLSDIVFVRVRPHSALAAENLFLRKQLALFRERKVKPRRADDPTRWTMATLSRIFPWRDALVNVKADTLLRWPRKGFRLFWRWKSQPTGRPRLPRDLRHLIRRMAAENPIWG